MRRSIGAFALLAGVGVLSALSPVAQAATGSAGVATAPPGARPAPSLGSFGVRLVDVPVSEADNPRALRYIIDELPTGSVIHRRILLINNEHRAVRFAVYPDAAHIIGGLFVGDSGATRSELTTWTSVRHPSVTLAPGKSAMDMVTIRVPKGAARGEHYGVIWVQQAARPKPGARFAVSEVARVGVRIYLAVTRGGVPPTKYEITSVTGRWLASGQPLVVARVKNTGGRAVDLSGTLRLTDGPGRTRSGPFPAQKIVTLAPGQSWDITFAPPRSLPEGSWRATVSLGQRHDHGHRHGHRPARPAGRRAAGPVRDDLGLAVARRPRAGADAGHGTVRAVAPPPGHRIVTAARMAPARGRGHPAVLLLLEGQHYLRQLTRDAVLRPGVDRGVGVDDRGLPGHGILRDLEQVEQLPVGGAT